MTKAVRSNVIKPVFPLQKDRPASLLLLRNEGSRALQIIGDHALDGIKVMPGSSFELDIAALDGPVQLTFCDGGIQVDCVTGVDRPVGGDRDMSPVWAVPPF